MILQTGEACVTPEWVVERFLGSEPEDWWWQKVANNKRFYAEVTETERDQLVLACAWAGDNLFSRRYDYHDSGGAFGPSNYQLSMTEANLMWRTARRLDPT